MSRRVKVRDDERVEGRSSHGRPAHKDNTPAPMQTLLELQRTAGNQAVADALATGPVQRQDAKPSDAPIDLRRPLLNLHGVSYLKCPDPTPPWLPKAGAAGPAKADSDDPSNLWTLDFDALVDDDSPLGKQLARAKRERL